MATECYFRNPRYYIRELVEERAFNVAFHSGYLIRRRLDPLKFVDLYMRGESYSILVVNKAGTVEYRPGDTLLTPSAVYPTWEYGGDSGALHSMLERPVGDEPSITGDESLPHDVRPIAGQRHKVVVTGAPPSTSRLGGRFLRFIGDLQEQYSEAAIHMHGYWSYKAAFGCGAASADVEPRADAAMGRIITPAGYVTDHEKTIEYPLWASALGFLPVDLQVPRNRCIYNIRSALWAARNFEEDVRFGVTRRLPPEDSSRGVPIITSPRGGREKPGDRILCDVCTLVMSCKFARREAVCSVPDSEVSSLPEMFGSRDSSKIIDGLGRIVSIQASRLERGIASEEASEDGELDPHVTKLASQVFDEGVKLARLVDPSLARPGVHVSVNTQGGGAAIVQGNPAQLVSAVYHELESRGMSRADITPDVVREFLSGITAQPVALPTPHVPRGRVIEQGP